MMWKLILVLATATLAGYRVWALRKQNEPAAQALGLRFDRDALRNILAGATISFFAISLVFLIETTSGLLTVERMGPPSALLNDFLTSLAVPFIEEFVFRCALLGALLLLLRNVPAAVLISAALFGILHAKNPNATVLSLASTFLGGLVYAIAFVATQRIWLPFGLHFGWNYAQGRLFGFHLSGGQVRPPPFIQQYDSGPALLTGGAYGPEGGLIGLMARLVTLALLLVWLRHLFHRPAISSSFEGAGAVQSHPKR